MRLFHVSEEADIQVFHPRLPTRKDLDPDVGLVWAIDEERLPNFLTPRNCPRVGYYSCKTTTAEDQLRFFSSSTVSHAIVIEGNWLKALQSTTLYLYEFDPKAFLLQDDVAGYYVSVSTQHPLQKHVVTDLLKEIVQRNVEIRITDNLWDVADAVQKSTLKWSLCRMAYASPKR